ncbi:MAG: putative deacylase [Candidatus Methanohalarchaeum thermophilum]|uniref:Deacylase n=1 Tax=Methanohalarchaeum thermophilum TaxID=1903181 RepID=A0A1Q6DU33_METT1|nr:MAG: putative deacylase [Candidatus Methanohalarchaeum thermophilum]
MRMENDSLDVKDFELGEYSGKESFRLRTFDLGDGSNLSLPCGVISREEGPTVCIVGGQHGIEWNGTYISQKIFKQIDKKKVTGNLVVLPILNPLAFNQKSRVSSIDSIDLNRTYLSKNYRKPTERLGKLLFENIFSKMDYVVDVHTGGPGEYLPHAAVTNRKRISEASLILPYIYVAKNWGNTLVSSSESQGIRSILLEIGRGRNINYEYVDKTIDGLKNYLKATKLLKGSIDKRDEDVFVNKEKIGSPFSGFFKSNVELGEYIEEGEVIGIVEKILGKKEEIYSPISGRILYLRRERAVAEGESIVHIFW